MIEVVEEQPADGQGAEGIETGGGMFDWDAVVIGLVREGDESGEPVGFILEFAELTEVIDSIGEGLDVSVEHGAGAAAAKAMPGAVDIEVFGGGFLAAGDGASDLGGEDFGAAAGEGIETGVTKGLEGLGDGVFGEPGEVEDFDGGEALQLQSRVEGFEGAEEIEVIGEGQGRMETADDMQFGDAEGEGFAGFGQHLVEGQLEAVGVAFLAGEGAELATEDAVIGVIEVAVDEVGGVGSDAAVAEFVGQGTEGVEVAGSEEGQGFLGGEALAVEESLAKGLERGALPAAVHVGACIALKATGRKGRDGG
jgi:hypothetical protein